MATVMNYVKEAYPNFFNDVQDRSIDIDVTRKKYAHILPTIEADVTAFARENGIDFKFNLA